MFAAADVLTASSVRPPPPALLMPKPQPPPAAAAPAQHTVHWFRKGLRLHDNPSLREGLVNAATFRCVFLIDPWFATSSNVGINKWRFLLECLEDLDDSLKKLHSRLFVIRGQPADALPKLFKEWGTTLLTFEEDPEPYGRVRDHKIISKCREIGVKVISRVSHTLYKLDKIIERNGGKAPLTYHQFQALIASMPPPLPVVPNISAESLNGAVTPLRDDHDDRFGVPTLEELGFETEFLKPPVWVGGESEALTRLGRHLERKAWVATFGRPKMTPQSLLSSKTGLSPYLRFGCLSTRLFYYQLTELYKKVKRVQPPLSLHGQILWREFFYCAATRNPNFDRMEGNPICVQIPWQRNDEALAKWGNGQTGFPWIDAIMIQLREEGWIHHLSRHAVACFLTRGDLWISWEEGMKVFDELMLDADWSVNAGMWMWLSCSSFFQQFFHCYCPVRFGRKTDPNGDFIRRYIPALKNIPTQYIHEPWMAPESVQEAAQCIIGQHYPRPIVDHAHVSQINIQRIQLVYAELANFAPQGPLNPIAVQRPNEMQSSPSPTSIIASINQSKYLCSRSPDTQASLTVIPYKNSQTFQHTMKLAPTHRMTPNDSKYKEIVILHEGQNSSDTLENFTKPQKTFVANSKIDASYALQTQELRPSSINENIEYKDIGEIDSCVHIKKYNFEKDFYGPDYLDKAAIYHTHPEQTFMLGATNYSSKVNKEETNDSSDDLKILNIDKAATYHTHTAPTFMPGATDYSIGVNNEETNDNSDDLKILNIDPDRSFTSDNDVNYQAN